MAAMLPITGTVSVGFDGSETQAVGTFSIPVLSTFDPETGLMHLEGVTDSTMIFAMVAALQGAATQLLDTLPTATVETADTAGPFNYCPTCTAALEDDDDSMTVSHGPNGQHIADQRY